MNVYIFTYKFSSILVRLLRHSFFPLPFHRSSIALTVCLSLSFAHNYRFTTVPRVVMWLLLPSSIVHFTRCIMCCEQHPEIGKFNQCSFSYVISFFFLHHQISIINIQNTCFNQKICPTCKWMRISKEKFKILNAEIDMFF